MSTSPSVRLESGKLRFYDEDVSSGVDREDLVQDATDADLGRVYLHPGTVDVIDSPPLVSPSALGFRGLVASPTLHGLTRFPAADEEGAYSRRLSPKDVDSRGESGLIVNFNGISLRVPKSSIEFANFNPSEDLDGYPKNAWLTIRFVEYTAAGRVLFGPSKIRQFDISQDNQYVYLKVYNNWLPDYFGNSSVIWWIVDDTSLPHGALTEKVSKRVAAPLSRTASFGSAGLILLSDSPPPGAIDFNTPSSGSPGSSDEVSRIDHTHAVNNLSSAGSSPGVAQLSSDVPGVIVFSGGSSAVHGPIARADHVHAISSSELHDQIRSWVYGSIATSVIHSDWKRYDAAYTEVNNHASVEDVHHPVWWSDVGINDSNMSWIQANVPTGADKLYTMGQWWPIQLARFMAYKRDAGYEYVRNSDIMDIGSKVVERTWEFDIECPHRVDPSTRELFNKADSLRNYPAMYILNLNLAIGGLDQSGVGLDWENCANSSNPKVANPTGLVSMRITCTPSGAAIIGGPLHSIVEDMFVNYVGSFTWMQESGLWQDVDTEGASVSPTDGGTFTGSLTDPNDDEVLTGDQVDNFDDPVLDGRPLDNLGLPRNAIYNKWFRRRTGIVVGTPISSSDALQVEQDGRPLRSYYEWSNTAESVTGSAPDVLYPTSGNINDVPYRMARVGLQTDEIFNWHPAQFHRCDFFHATQTFNDVHSSALWGASNTSGPIFIGGGVRGVDHTTGEYSPFWLEMSIQQSLSGKDIHFVLGIRLHISSAYGLNARYGGTSDWPDVDPDTSVMDKYVGLRGGIDQPPELADYPEDAGMVMLERIRVASYYSIEAITPTFGQRYGVSWFYR